jgi:CubicO group peptidase (beta-lactamase class C family)
VKDQRDKPVTFTHILSHWSGLKNGAETQPIWGRKLPKTLEAMTAGLSSVRAPETRWEYNNFAYGTAGLLVQKISGVEYEKYMVDNVLKPLGVTTAHPVYPSPEMVERMALPYKAGGSLGKPAPEVQVHFDVYPAGDIYLTAEDMARYLAAQLNGGVFSGTRSCRRSRCARCTRSVLVATMASASGWFTTAPAATPLIHHGGAIGGQRAFLIGDLDARVGVYYMTNSDYCPTRLRPRNLRSFMQRSSCYAERTTSRGRNRRASRWTRSCSTATSAPTR